MEPSKKKKRRSTLGRECASFSCSNTQYLKDGSPSGLSFFKFPLKNPKRSRWCNLIKRQHGRDGFFVNNLTVVCEKHFKKEEIYKPPGGTRCRLKEGVEPSIFTWLPSDLKPTRRVLSRQSTDPKSSCPIPTSHLNTITNLEQTEVEGLEDMSQSMQEDEESILPSTSMLEIEDCHVSFENEDLHLSSTNEKKWHEIAVQTDAADFVESDVYQDHSYSFLLSTKTTFGEQKDYIKRLEEKIEEQSLEINNLKRTVGHLEKQLDHYKKKRFILENFKDDDCAIQFYTGFPNYKALLAVYEYLEPKVNKLQYWGGKTVPDSKPYQENSKSKPGPKRSITGLDEFWMVLVRLKVGLFVKDLSDRFAISPGHFSKIFSTWINFLSLELKLLFPFPSQVDVLRNLPVQFSRYPRTRVIIDCTEVFIEVPSSMKAQSETWSNYKHHNTFKVLVGVSPNGQVTFVSKLWGGRVSDKAITKESGILSLLDVGDNVMADRGFDIEDILPQGVNLNLPPFKGTREQLTAKEVEETARIASVRIHVERAIGRIKNYHILDGVLPVSLSHVADQIFTVCSYLTNILPPLLPPARNDSQAKKHI